MHRDAVVDAAFEVLGPKGLDGLTVRAIARRLRVENPALYWYFKNKQEIVDAMALRLMRRAVTNPAPNEPWDKWLARAARAFRRVLRSYRDAPRLIASANLSGAQEHIEVGVQHLRRTGLSGKTALHALVAVFDYVLGATFESTEDPHADARADDPAFEAGLGFLIAGIRAKTR